MNIMAKAVNVSLRIDEDVKRDSEELFGELGPTLCRCERVPESGLYQGGVHFDVRIGTPNQTTCLIGERGAPAKGSRSETLYGRGTD